jgi:DNA-binding IclR family transcriptional regulator
MEIQPVRKESSMSSLVEWNTAPERPRPPSTVLHRIVAILDAVRDADGPLSVTALASQIAMPKSTVSRLVTELTAQRYLQRVDGGVTLGLRLFELGARANLPRRLVGAAVPIIGDLAKQTGERVGLWVHQGNDMIAIAAVPGRLPMLPTRAGTRCPALTTASGKAFLAFCPDPRVLERVSAALPHDAADELREELTHVRSAVVATDTGVAFPGVDAIATPVLSTERTVVGAISVAGPAGTIDRDDVAELVLAAGVSLGRRLTAA